MKHPGTLANAYTFWRCSLTVWRDGGLWSFENTPLCLAISFWRIDFIWDKGGAAIDAAEGTNKSE